MSARRLLLVEDDRALADLIGFHFERDGWAVTRTGDGEEALILAEEVSPGLVILDWMIEGISGIEVCRRLRRKPATARLPIIMLTARGEEADRIRGLETGADDYMTKPFSPKELVARAAAVLRRARPSLAAERLDFDHHALVRRVGGDHAAEIGHLGAHHDEVLGEIHEACGLERGPRLVDPPLGIIERGRDRMLAPETRPVGIATAFGLVLTRHEAGSCGDDRA